MKKQPEQTQATRQKLLDAFWTIYQKKNIDKITIAEITRTAGYNRGTFYEYFSDIYEVLDQIEDELLDQINTEIQLKFQAGLPNNINEYSLRCASIFKKYEDKVFHLLGSSGDSKFGAKLQAVFFPTFTKIAHLSPDIPHSDYVASFVFSSLIGMMTHWYENRKNLSEEEFIGLMQKLVASGVMGYMNISLFKEL